MADFRKDRPIYVALGDTVHGLLHLMSDLRGFTAMSERMAAHSLISMLNHYLGEMPEIIQRRNGTITEFIGGGPHITHAVAVAGILRDWGYGADHQIAGLFHDLPEDTDASEQEIESIGGADVLRTVRLLAKQIHHGRVCGGHQSQPRGPCGQGGEPVAQPSLRRGGG